MAGNIWLTSVIQGVFENFASQIHAATSGSKTILVVSTLTRPQHWFTSELDYLEKCGFEPRVVVLNEVSSADDFRRLADSCGSIYLSGGRAVRIVEEVGRLGLREVFHSYIQQGMPWVASSAGTVFSGLCAVAGIREDDIDRWCMDEPLGLGLVRASMVCHWGGEDWRAPSMDLRLPILHDLNTPVILLPDGAWIHVHDNNDGPGSFSIHLPPFEE